MTLLAKRTPVPEVELMAGGGVRDAADLRAGRRRNAGALVATAPTAAPSGDGELRALGARRVPRDVDPRRLSSRASGDAVTSIT